MHGHSLDQEGLIRVWFPEVEITRYSIKSGLDTINKRVGWDWNLQVDRRCNVCLLNNLTPIREAPTCCQAGTPPVVVQFLGSKKRRLAHCLYVFRRRAVGTWSPAYYLCRTLHSVDLRTHTHPWASQVRTPLLAPSFTRCI